MDEIFSILNANIHTEQMASSIQRGGKKREEIQIERKKSVRRRLDFDSLEEHPDVCMTPPIRAGNPLGTYFDCCMNGECANLGLFRFSPAVQVMED